MTTSNEKSMHLKSFNSLAQLLVQEFYNLRKAFQADYSGKLRSYKYEETREFTIALNYAIFQANQIGPNDTDKTKSLRELSSKLEMMKQNYKVLIQ